MDMAYYIDPKMTEIVLKDAARFLKVHPRSIIRAITGKTNINWDEDELISIEKLAKAYSTTARALNTVFRGRDELLTTKEVADMANICVRTVWARKYKPTLKYGKNL